MLRKLVHVRVHVHASAVAQTQNRLGASIYRSIVT
jgi:hypothetical protein